jgi:orotate phosphoribosyltransferase
MAKSIDEALAETEAVLTNDHFVYASMRHGPNYINKDAVYPHTVTLSRLCTEIANRFGGDEVDTVVGPAMGGVMLSTWTAYHLSRKDRPVMGVYAEKEKVQIPDPEAKGPEDKERNCYAETGEFEFNRGYKKFVEGKRVLVVEDILTTGGSVKKVVEAVRKAGGVVVGVCALVNRGGVTPEAVGVERLEALKEVSLPMYEARECPLCANQVPVNTELGKGKQFLANQNA